MKSFILAAVMAYSGTSFAGLSCTSQDSFLRIKPLAPGKIEVQLTEKYPQTRVPTPYYFKGELAKGQPSPYYKEELYKLTNNFGKATLKLMTIPVLSRPCGRRICDDFETNNSKEEIIADLDYAGKITRYDCTQI